MAVGTFIILGLTGLALGYAATVPVRRRNRLRRRIAQAPRVAIADFPDGGEAKIVGRIAFEGEPLRGPLSGRDCAYYEAVVEEMRRDAGWHEIIREVRARPFRIEDDTGCALVDPSRAQVALVVDTHSESGKLDGATALEKQFLRRHDEKSTGLLLNKTLRYREGALEAGEEVAVLGHGTLEPDPEAVGATRGYRQGPAMRVRIGGTRRKPLLMSDHLDALGTGARLTE